MLVCCLSYDRITLQEAWLTFQGACSFSHNHEVCSLSLLYGECPTVEYCNLAMYSMGKSGGAYTMTWRGYVEFGYDQSLLWGHMVPFVICTTFDSKYARLSIINSKDKTDQYYPSILLNIDGTLSMHFQNVYTDRNNKEKKTFHKKSNHSYA